MNWSVGDRVRLNRDVDIFPLIVMREDEVGTIASVNDEAIFVRMDKHYPELDEWDNALEVWREWHEDALTRI